MEISQQKSVWSWPKHATILLLGLAAVVFLAVSFTGSEPINMKERKSLAIESARPDACLENLGSKMASLRADGDVLTLVPASDAALYHFFDESGAMRHTRLWESKNRANALAKQLKSLTMHKTYFSGNKMSVVYENNVVVEADMAQCRVMNVFEATPNGRQHPLASADAQAYGIKGKATGGYLRHDPNPSNILANTDIDAAASLGRNEKFNLELSCGTLNITGPTPSNAKPTIYFLRVLSARPTVTFKYLTMTGSGDPTNFHDPNSVSEVNGLVWYIYEALPGGGVKFPALYLGSQIVGKDVVLYSPSKNNCLCINGKTQTTGAVTGCDCSSANAVLNFITTTDPTSLAEEDEEEQIDG